MLAVHLTNHPALTGLLSTGLALLFLAALGWLAFRKGPVLSALTAILAYAAQYTLAGCFSALLMLCGKLPPLIPYMGWLLLVCGLLHPAALYVLYRQLAGRYAMEQAPANRYVLALALPALLVLLTSELVNGIYGNVVVLTTDAGVVFPRVNDLQMLAVQAVACGCLVVVLASYHRLNAYFEMRTQNAILAQQLAAQGDYLREVQARYQQTRSFRHDVKNHLLAVDGLLQAGRLEEARCYLDKLDGGLDALSFHTHTGNAAVDVLLGSKLHALRQSGVQVECALPLSDGGGVDSLDLCVILANAVDNAARACAAVEDGAYLRLTGRRQGQLLLLEVENSRGAETAGGTGLGLPNIRAVAEKYAGAVSTEAGAGYFRLNVLLVIPEQRDDI